MRRSLPARTTLAVVTISFLGLAYLGLHLWSISWFPFVHSDEAWLASLSRTMVQGGSVTPGVREIRGGGPAATEEFFRLTTRHPHALKTLYHLLQGPLVVRWWHPLAARIPSLIAGMGATVLVGLILTRLTGNLLVGLSMGAASALDVQLFYISHLARQEAMVVVLMLAAVALLVRARGSGVVKSLAAATIIGITIFIHPNAFVAAAAVFPWVVHTAGPGRRMTAEAVYVGGLAAGALLAIGVSLAMDPAFFANYAEFGASVGVSAGFLERFARLREFFLKIAGRHAGTYYLAPFAIQLWMLVAASLATIAVFVHARRRSVAPNAAAAGLTAVFSVVATVLALFIVGKYSPPSVVFLVPWLYITIGLLAGAVLAHLRGSGARIRSVVLITVIITIPLLNGIQLTRELLPPRPHEYRSYLERVRSPIPEGEVVLANLNTAFAFQPGELRVWRDLGALPPVPELPPAPSDELLLDRPFARFLRDERVRWVVVPVDELEKIYRERPVWNEVYGNPHRFYPELMAILDRYGTRVDRFVGGRYAMRLVPFMERGPHHVEVYRLDLP